MASENLPASEFLYFKKPEDTVKMQQLWKVMDDLQRGFISAGEAIAILNANAVIPDGVTKGDIIAFDGTNWVVVPASPDRSLIGYDSTTINGLDSFTPAEVVAYGLAVTDTQTIDLTLATNSVSGSVIRQMSITADASGLRLVNDELSPGISEYYGTNGAGTKGFFALPAAGGGGYSIVNVSTTPYTIVPTSGIYYYMVDTTLGNIIINFPTAVGNTANYRFFKVVDANLITLTPFAGQTINTYATTELKFKNTSIDVYSNNANLILA